MRKRFSFIALALCSAMPGAYAAPKIAGAKKVVNRGLVGRGAQQLFDALNLPLLENAGVAGKLFEAEENELEIQCRQSMETSVACAVSVSVEEIEGSSAMMISGRDAHALYDALKVNEFAGRLNDIKAFSDLDESVSVLCARNLIPNGDRYACSVEIRRR